MKKDRRSKGRARVLTAVIIAAAVATACNSDKKEAEAAIKQAATLAESGRSADLDEADKLLGEALKKDPGNPGIPPVAERIKAQRTGTVKAKGPPVASKADCEAACANNEEVDCQHSREVMEEKDTDPDLKRGLQEEMKSNCDAHGSRTSCFGICTKAWSPENAACVKAAKRKDQLDKCMKSKFRRMPPDPNSTWGKKVLSPEGFAAEQGAE